jgi:uncharacterized protein YdhG (YjbR/CyaY superfamily)
LIIFFWQSTNNLQLAANAYQPPKERETEQNMAAQKKKFETIDEYIETFPEDVQGILQELRQTIRAAAPQAKEAISYQMPTFKLNGNLVHFAAYKKHIGFYPAPSGIEAFQEELAPYKASKGAVQFPIEQPIPHDLVSKIVQFRVAEQLNKVAG